MDTALTPHLRTARIIAASLVNGVVLFWIIAWVIGAHAAVTPETQPAGGIQLWIAVAVGLAGFMAARNYRGRALQGVEDVRRFENRRLSIEALEPLQRNLMIAWAFLEGPALLSGALFYLSGATQLLWAAAPVYVIGMAMTFPRAAWFGA